MNSDYNPRWNCKDCGLINPQWFWVSQATWEEAGLKLYKDGIFCLSCFVNRLKRPMTLADFDDNGPCSNDAIKFMYALGQIQGIANHSKCRIEPSPTDPNSFTLVRTLCEW